MSRPVKIQKVGTAQPIVWLIMYGLLWFICGLVSGYMFGQLEAMKASADPISDEILNSAHVVHAHYAHEQSSNFIYTNEALDEISESWRDQFGIDVSELRGLSPVTLVGADLIPLRGQSRLVFRLRDRNDTTLSLLVSKWTGRALSQPALVMHEELPFSVWTQGSLHFVLIGTHKSELIQYFRKGVRES